MADILRIKRRAGGAAGAPTTLANAELAYNETDHTLYIGEGTGGAGGSATVIVPVGGAGLASSATPQMDGVGAAGTATQLTRSDHVHPSDTSRAPLASPVFTGTPAAPTAARPNNTTQVATTAFVTGAISDAVQGLSTKAAVEAATTANITLSGAQTIDGVAVAGGDRVLVKDQAAPANNGIYLVQVGAWTRAPDLDAWNEVQDAYTFVKAGTVNADTGWVCTADNAGTIGTTAMPWVQFSAAGQIVAGNGLSKSGNRLDVVGTPNRVVSSGAGVDIAPNYAGQTSITAVGAVTTGAWNASVIGVPYGGTGAATLTGYVKGTGVTAMTASATIPSTDIAGLGTMAAQNANAVAITGGTIDGVTLDGGTF